MSSVFDFSADRRGKSTKQSRVGFGSEFGTLLQGSNVAMGAHARISKKQMTPNQLQTWNLTKVLERYEMITPELRTQWRDEFINDPQITTMNMQIMAAALVILYFSNNDINPTTFNQYINNVIPYISIAQESELSATDKQRITEGNKTSIFRYIRHIVDYRNKRQEADQALLATLNQSQLTSPSQQL